MKISFLLYIAVLLSLVIPFSKGDCTLYREGSLIKMSCDGEGKWIITNYGVYNFNITLNRCDHLGVFDCAYAFGGYETTTSIKFPLNDQKITIYQVFDFSLALEISQFQMTAAWVTFDLNLDIASLQIPVYHADFGNQNVTDCELPPNTWCTEEMVPCAWVSWKYEIVGGGAGLFICLFFTCCCCCFCCRRWRKRRLYRKNVGYFQIQTSSEYYPSYSSNPNPPAYANPPSYSPYPTYAPPGYSVSTPPRIQSSSSNSSSYKSSSALTKTPPHYQISHSINSEE